MLLFWIAILAGALYFLVKSADYFTDYAEHLGRILKLPNFIIGVMIVAVGTSIPELVTSMIGVSRGELEFLSGTVMGSSIANILLVLGISVLLCKKKATFTWDIVSNDLPFLAASIFLVIVSLLDGVFSTGEAIIFLLGYVVYVIYAYAMQKSERADIRDKFEKELKLELKEKGKEPHVKDLKKEAGIVKSLIFLAISLVVVVLASNYVVEAVVNLAGIIGFASSAIAASAVAFGTSLPELMVGVAAARRGNFDMVVGNVLGSNIFNVFVVYGVVGLFAPLTISASAYMTMIPFMVGSFILMWLTLLDKRLSKTEALMFVLVYVLFIAKLFHFF